MPADNKKEEALPTPAVEIHIVDGVEYKAVKEGAATILFPNTNEVFYNPVQQFNRDMSIAAIRTWSDMWRSEGKELPRSKRRKMAAPGEDSTTFTILEALSATGLRSVRYAKEIPGIKNIIANDLEPDAVESIRRNVKFNNLTEDLVKPNHGDAMNVLYAHRRVDDRFDVIDLDPYGSASIFLDGAIQAVNDGGLLCITCTDLAVLAGSSYTEACFAKYGGASVKADFCHEMALRLVIHALNMSAARYKRHIVPVLSCSIDFYVRIFVRVYTSPKEVKYTASKTAMVYNCTGCNSYWTQPLGKVIKTEKGGEKYGVVTGPPIGRCTYCGSRCHVGGPFWHGKLHDETFVRQMIQHIEQSPEDAYGTRRRMIGMLTVIAEEIDAPFYVSPSTLAKTIHSICPNVTDLNSALLNAGYDVSFTHASQGAIKTNASFDVIWDIMRGWIKKNPIKDQEEGTPSYEITKKPATLEADFTVHPKAKPASRFAKLVRYQENPTKFWGPKARHGKQTLKQKVHVPLGGRTEAQNASKGAKEGARDKKRKGEEMETASKEEIPKEESSKEESPKEETTAVSEEKV